MRLFRICWLLIVLSQMTPTIASSKNEEAIQQIESNLLSMFGFKKKPKVDRSKIVIPQAMIREYEKQTGKKLNTVNLAKPGLHTQSANTMRSFVHIESKVDEKFKGHHKFRLYFDVDAIPAGEVLKSAELVFTRQNITNLGDSDYSQVIELFDIIKPGVKGKHKPITRLIDVKKVDVRKSGSISFNVHPAVVRWLEFPRQNYGILVKVSEKVGKKPHVRVRRSSDQSQDDWAQVQPILFAYTDDQRYQPATGASILANRRSRRAAKGSKKKPKPQCKRHSMYVDFTDVGWSDWIVAPPGYDAYYCSGECTFPFAEYMNTTNHAIIQTIVNSMNPVAGVPKACCVPTTLSSISMLYLDEYRKVVLKNYKEMAVQGCGCR